MTSRRNLGRSYRFAIAVVRPLLMLLTRRDWRGAEHLQRDGGFLVCPNHISYVDPLAFGHFLLDNGHAPYFLGKEAVFRIPVVGRIIAGAGQIPVYRETGDAAKALSAAVEAVHEGKTVAIYPEATITRDPGLWPMVGKTGAARLALTTGCPVIPVAQWGPQDLLAPYAKRLRLLPRKTMHMLAGPPVDLDDLRGKPLDGPVLREATARIMAAITGLLEQLRGEAAPPERFDPRAHGLPTTGNPNRPQRPPRHPPRHPPHERPPAGPPTHHPHQEAS